MTDYQPVIGLEVHAQLQTESKLFCGCPIAFGASPNSHTCEVCLGMPGVLPVVNKKAVTLALRAAVALHCDIQESSQWSRKNYFYPDLPKGYQITQFDKPYALQGYLEIKGANEHTLNVPLTRIHMEEDAGKSAHSVGAGSIVDYNRGGTPLIEIVSDPALHTAADAANYMRELRQLLRYIGVCDGNMEQASMRCDANVSLRPVGTSKLGTRVELKNINSFRFVEDAINYEIARQTHLLDAGQKITQETRLWDSQKRESRSMRGKEEAHDYRYFPEPDMPLLHISLNDINTVKENLTELPAIKLKRFISDYALSFDDAKQLTYERELAQFYEDALGDKKDAKLLVNWVLNDLLAVQKNTDNKIGDLCHLPFTANQFGGLISMIGNQEISGKIAKQIFSVMLKNGGDPAQLVTELGLSQISNSDELEQIIDELLVRNTPQVDAYRAGKVSLLGFFVGQVMKATQGKANPQMVNELLKKRLS